MGILFTRAATATCLLVGLLSSSASTGAPTFTYQFIVDSVVCERNPGNPTGICDNTPALRMALDEMTITFNLEAWERGSAEYFIGEDPPLVNTGVLAIRFEYEGLSPIFHVEPPPDSVDLVSTVINVGLSDFLSGGVRWSRSDFDGAVFMEGAGTSWDGQIVLEFWPHDFTGYWLRVPEPSSITLLTVGLASLALTRRRRSVARHAVSARARRA